MDLLHGQRRSPDDRYSPRQPQNLRAYVERIVDARMERRRRALDCRKEARELHDDGMTASDAGLELRSRGHDPDAIVDALAFVYS